jgi:hypothetical protein
MSFCCFRRSLAFSRAIADPPTAWTATSRIIRDTHVHSKCKCRGAINGFSMHWLLQVPKSLCLFLCLIPSSSFKWPQPKHSPRATISQLTGFVNVSISFFVNVFAWSIADYHPKTNFSYFIAVIWVEFESDHEKPALLLQLFNLYHLPDSTESYGCKIHGVLKINSWLYFCKFSTA